MARLWWKLAICRLDWILAGSFLHHPMLCSTFLTCALASLLLLISFLYTTTPWSLHRPSLRPSPMLLLLITPFLANHLHKGQRWKVICFCKTWSWTKTIVLEHLMSLPRNVHAILLDREQWHGELYCALHVWNLLLSSVDQCNGRQGRKMMKMPYGK